MDEAITAITGMYEWIKSNPGLTTLLTSGIAGTGGTVIFSFLRRIKPSKDGIGQYFSDSKMLSTPMKRPAYSDRMAYVLAEMSDLAYYEFEGPGGFVNDAVENAMKLKLDNSDAVRQFLESFSKDLMGNRKLSVDFLKDLLNKSGFELLSTINVAETQGFACKRNVPGQPPYMVIAFRGTEKKVSDWLTDANAVPTEEGKKKVHTGFLEAFTVKTDQDGMTTKDRVEEIINATKAKDQNGEPLPLFITGHSLGGAIALLATKLMAPDINGASYTFGAPRVANYEYLENVKTPVYRVVNSSDIVPRVPPGAGMIILVGLAKLFSWLTWFAPAVSSLFDKLESFLDKLSGYRHFGDLRYLTDVATGRFSDVKLLSNPPAIDRAIWLWKQVAASFFVPLKSHGMSLYRKKLLQIANNRNRKI